MTSGMRHILSETVLWVSVFTISLAGFFYLDDRIGAYLEQRAETAQKIAQQAVVPEESDEEQSEPAPARIRQENTTYGRVVLHAGQSGHFEVKAYINDRSVNLLADTGASLVVLTYEDAQTLGLTDNLQFSGRARTANGVSKVAPIMLESVEVGDIMVNNVQAIIAEEGRLHKSLLGMSFIGQLESFQMMGRELILVQ